MLPLKDDVEAQSFPTINVLLILANIVAFAYQFTQPESFVTQWGVVPARFVHDHDLGQVVTMFTSMFMHGGIAHLVGNMWFLWIFGDNVEDRLGHFEYLIFYLLCGMAGDVASIYMDPAQTMPSIGASGAIAGVMGAYLLMFPEANIKMWFDEFWLFTFNWPAWAVIGEWWVMQYFLGVVVHETASHVGYYAHLGGFAAGMVLGLIFAKRDVQPVYTQNYSTNDNYDPYNRY